MKGLNDLLQRDGLSCGALQNEQKIVGKPRGKGASVRFHSGR